MSEQHGSVLQTPYYPTDKTDKSPIPTFCQFCQCHTYAFLKCTGGAIMKRRYEVQDSFGRCSRCGKSALRRRERYDKVRDKARIEQRCLACGHRCFSVEKGAPAWL